MRLKGGAKGPKQRDPYGVARMHLVCRAKKRKQTERNALNHYLSSGNLQGESNGLSLNKHRNSTGAQFQTAQGQLNKSHSV